MSDGGTQGGRPSGGMPPSKRVGGVARQIPRPDTTPRRDGQRTRCASGLSPDCREKPLASVSVPVPHTDTGRQVEQTEVDGRPLVKELGNMAP
jgi:hypothetical protein